MGWDQDKPIVAILASDLTDGVFINSWSLFKDRLTWIRKTLLEITNIKNINWLLKPHPNDEKHKVVTDTITWTKDFSPIGIKISRSFNILEDFVIIEVG